MRFENDNVEMGGNSNIIIYYYDKPMSRERKILIRRSQARRILLCVLDANVTCVLYTCLLYLATLLPTSCLTMYHTYTSNYLPTSDLAGSTTRRYKIQCVRYDITPTEGAALLHKNDCRHRRVNEKIIQTRNPAPTTKYGLDRLKIVQHHRI